MYVRKTNIMNRQNLSMGVGGTINLCAISGGSVSAETATWENVCGVLAHLSDNCSRYARIKYRLEHHYRPVLVARMINDAMRILTKHGKNNIAPQALIETALDESCSDNTCKGKSGCNGVGVISNKSCPRCNGTGHKGWSNRRICKGLGVGSTRYKRDYEGVYSDARALFDRFEAEISSELYKSSERY